MGIPKFFRWLSDRYPLINQRLDETHEFDNFYLDMNGIIHQCTHPNDGEIVAMNLEDMFSRMFEYTDRLYRIVRPRRLLFLAVDGVAPRAKMNQQRSRRYRSAQESERALAEAKARQDEIPEGEHFDSNCITPGTEFMFELSKRFKAWIKHKMSTDPCWQQGCNVVFSGPESPGEGEHKIMDCVRAWRSSSDWTPSVRHCMYGLDADLIMLGLVAHEPHFTLLREKMKWRNKKKAVPKYESDRADDGNEFELLEISLLRDMLYLEFKPQAQKNSGGPSSGMNTAGAKRTGGVSGITTGPLGFKYEAHRVVDDFVFMCMLVGNDFVPHLPHLDIAEGALNIMFRVYKELLPAWNGYLTKAHRLHPDRLETFIQRVSHTEPQFFENRAMDEGEPGFRKSTYRKFYYETKLGIQQEDTKFLHTLNQHYLEGLHWVLQYYHNGCQSWDWYFPHLYGPLASDLKNLRQYSIRFKKGKPFRPIEQLLAVLPPASAALLPVPYRELMINDDSPVKESYPTEFTVDLNGKRNSWEAVVIIPFIDEAKLLKATRSIDPDRLSPAERARNRMGSEKVYLARDFPVSKEYIPAVRPENRVNSRYRRAESVSQAARRYMESKEGIKTSTRRPSSSAPSSPRRKTQDKPFPRRRRASDSTLKEPKQPRNSK
mmetsp:Transcript_11284/g.20392  ORF Transcript_11284/g.20392 Transcript_11284/m.20392 type:complete len:658 (+) Transcript_11284:94-2067(+)